jgi:hypothetical protein
MLKMGVTLFLTSSFAVLCRVADCALFSSLIVKILCLTALSFSLGIFVVVLVASEYKERQGHDASQRTFDAIHAGARI